MNNNEQLIINYDKIINLITNVKNRQVHLVGEAISLIYKNIKLLLSMYKNKEKIEVPSYVIYNTIFLANHCNFTPTEYQILTELIEYTENYNTKTR